MERIQNKRKIFSWSLGITTFVVAAIYIIGDLFFSVLLPRKSLLVVGGVFGFFLTNITIFSITILRSLGQAKLIYKEKELSNEEKEKIIEETMVPALQGETEPPKSFVQLSELPFGVSFGLILGAFRAWLVEICFNKIAC